MKKNLLITILILCGFYANVLAQLPKTSTAEDPIWYFIHLKGSDEKRFGRVLKLTGTYIYGDYLLNLTSTLNRNAALWRFEKHGNNYTIINRRTNQSLDITKAPTEIEDDLNIATLAANPSVSWSIVTAGNYFQIKSSSGVYLHQTNDGGNRNFVIMTLDDDEWAFSDDSYFQFLEYKSDNALQISDDKESHWYRIVSGNPNFKNKCITDISAGLSEKIKFELKDSVKDNTYQQWKLIKPINTSTGTTYFVNKATGNIIVPEYDFNGFYNAQSATTTDNKLGWTLGYLASNQYIVSGFNEAGVKGYLNVASSLLEPTYLSDNIFNSSYSWAFEKLYSGPETSILYPDADNFPDHIKVYTIDKRIIVEGTDNYLISHISGTRISNDQYLATGVYLVTIEGQKTIAILVK